MTQPDSKLAAQAARRVGRASQRLRSAAAYAATPSPTGGLAGEHLVEALIGGGLALVMTQLLFPCPPGERPGGQGAVY
jgi:hypothetical protein